MDEFAQTRAADNLFDDDFTPLSEPISRSCEAQPPQPQRNKGIIIRSDESQPTLAGDNSTKPQSRASDSLTTLPLSSHSNSTFPTSPPPTQFRSHTPVRGDRHLTGGVVKPKLTEEELSAKLAAAKLNNAKRAEAHRLAEADEASFQQREAKANRRRQEEGRARKIMDLERERNRLRKLKGREGREWDEGKEEQREDRGSEYRRGANGGFGCRGGQPNSLYHYGRQDRNADQQRGGYDFRGRFRGGRGRAGSSRENFEQRNTKVEQRAPDPQQDFPALPQMKKPNGLQPLPPDKMDNSLEVKTLEPSWADQVAEAKNSF